MTNASDKIAQFLKDARPSTKGGVAEILSSKDLFTDGWMDSLLHLSLLGFIEKEFHVKVPALCVSRKSFLSVNSIVALLKN
mgnify:CR=1 FL=1